MKTEEFRRKIIEPYLNVWVNGTWTWNENGSVDVEGNVEILNFPNSKLPFKFGTVNGWFICSDNSLTTLEGVPDKVTKNFGCSRNRLKTLKFAPKEVGGHFWCQSNFTKFTEEDVRNVCQVYDNIYV